MRQRRCCGSPDGFSQGGARAWRSRAVERPEIPEPTTATRPLPAFLPGDLPRLRSILRLVPVLRWEAGGTEVLSAYKIPIPYRRTRGGTSLVRCSVYLAPPTARGLPCSSRATFSPRLSLPWESSHRSGWPPQAKTFAEAGCASPTVRLCCSQLAHKKSLSAPPWVPGRRTRGERGFHNLHHGESYAHVTPAGRRDVSAVQRATWARDPVRDSGGRRT